MGEAEPSSWETISVRTQGPISILTIERPERLNAISSKVAIDLQKAFKAFEASETQRVAIITGAGDRAFTSGADVGDLPELWRCIPTVGFTSEKPIIAATSGWCVGGGVVLVAMCDLMVAADTTKFYYPEGKLGLTAGMISSLAARMPHKVAMELMLLGQEFSVSRAYEVGFVNRVVPAGQQLPAAIAMAEQLCESAPLVVSTLKRLVTQHVLTRGPVEIMASVAAEIGQVRGSDDMQEGLRAFREKRKPNFTGR